MAGVLLASVLCGVLEATAAELELDAGGLDMSLVAEVEGVVLPAFGELDGALLFADWLPMSLVALVDGAAVELLMPLVAAVEGVVLPALAEPAGVPVADWFDISAEVDGVVVVAGVVVPAALELRVELPEVVSFGFAWPAAIPVVVLAAPWEALAELLIAWDWSEVAPVALDAEAPGPELLQVLATSLTEAIWNELFEALAWLVLLALELASLEVAPGAAFELELAVLPALPVTATVCPTRLCSWLVSPVRLMVWPVDEVNVYCPPE